MNTDYRIGAAVLIGGRSTRMGSPKENMIIKGDGRTFLDKICDEIDKSIGKCVETGYISLRRGQQVPEKGYVAVEDIYTGIGPLGGIISVLEAARRDGLDAVLILACDMIDYTESEIEAVCGCYSGEDILWVRTPGGDIQPLGSIYSTGIIRSAVSLASNGIYRLRALGDAVNRVGYYDSPDVKAYRNVNSL